METSGDTLRCDKCLALLLVYNDNGKASAICPECGGGDPMIVGLASIITSLRQMKENVQELVGKTTGKNTTDKRYPLGLWRIPHRVGATEIVVVFDDDEPVAIEDFNGVALNKDLSTAVICAEYQRMVDSYNTYKEDQRYNK